MSMIHTGPQAGRDPISLVPARLADWLDAKRPATPALALDLAAVAARYHRLAGGLPGARIHYAVKANPAPAILARLVREGAAFDAASVQEIRDCLAAGAPVSAISYGSTMKKAADIAFAHSLGVTLYAVDCEEEVRKIAAHAPGASIFVRLFVDNDGAEWPLTRKFGCGAGEALRLMRLAPQLGLDPAGLSFHVGSQQHAPAQYHYAIQRAATLYRELQGEGLPVRLLNLGGGFPARYREPVASLEETCAAIEAALATAFGAARPDILIEPGRGLVAEAAVIETEIVLATVREDGTRWLYLDIGRFNGLFEVEGDAIRFAFEPADPAHLASPTGPVILAGPTCDSCDQLYFRTEYHLPLSLQAGDRLRIASAGAYTSACASHFNGFAPPTEHFIDG